MAEEIHIGEVRNEVDKIWLREDGIVQIVVLPGADYKLADVKQSLAGIVQVSKGKLHPLLADIRNIKAIERAARQEIVAIPASTTVSTATAILIDSSLSRFIGKILIAFKKMPTPVRLFSSEAEAIKWLKGFLE